MLPKKLSNSMTMLSITVTIPNLDLKKSNNSIKYLIFISHKLFLIPCNHIQNPFIRQLAWTAKHKRRRLRYLGELI